VKDGANYSINTDDPVVLGNTLTDDYKFTQGMGLSDKDIIQGVGCVYLRNLNPCFIAVIK